MSESIRVHCYGICTHVLLKNDHRLTILPNASDQSRINSIPGLHKHGIHAHVASLTIRTSDIVGKAPSVWWFKARRSKAKRHEVTEWRLKGVQIELLKPGQSGECVTSECIPRLCDLVESREVPRRLAGGAALDSVNTACHLQLPPCRLEGANLKGGAIFTKSTLQTRGEPVLRVTRFNSTDSVDIHLAPDSEIALSNIPRTMHTGMDGDIVLHFLSTETVPVVTLVPLARRHCSKPEIPKTQPTLLGDTTGPGCSNTNYP